MKTQTDGFYSFSSLLQKHFFFKTEKRMNRKEFFQTVNCMFFRDLFFLLLTDHIQTCFTFSSNCRPSRLNFEVFSSVDKWKVLAVNSLLECFYSDKSLKLNDSRWRSTLAVVSSSRWVSCASVFSRSWRRCKCLEKGGWVKRTRSSFQPLGRPPPSPASSWKRSSFIFHGLASSGDSGMLRLASPPHRLGEKFGVTAG